MPFCCAFIPQTEYITRMVEKIGPLPIAIILALLGIIAMAMCPSISMGFALCFLLGSAALRIREFVLLRLKSSPQTRWEEDRACVINAYIGNEKDVCALASMLQKCINRRNEATGRTRSQGASRFQPESGYANQAGDNTVTGNAYPAATPAYGASDALTDRIAAGAVHGAVQSVFSKS
ncbi:hypothetical protein ACTXT7_001051 [Hymenolepis weldensis]